MNILKNNYLYLSLVIIIYLAITIVSLNHCYFWDNIQQTSKEAHWYYNTNFSHILLPSFSDFSEQPLYLTPGKYDITGTGYHPPFTGIVTALLWKIFGKSLWVSHIFIFCCSLILIFNAFKLFSILFPNKLYGAFIMLPLLDPSFLSQLSIAAPEIILMAAFVVCLRAIVCGKKILLSVGFIFLCLVNARGIFAGGIIFIFYWFYKIYCLKNKFYIKYFFKELISFLPAFVILIIFFAYYFSQRGWFFSDKDSIWASGYERPDSFQGLIKNICVYLFLLFENGRIFIWLFLFFMLKKIIYNGKNKRINLNNMEKSFLFLFVLFILMYLYIASSTKVSIIARYYMPIYFLLDILFFIFAERLKIKKINTYVFVLILFLLAGNLSVYIYPDKLAKNWDSTLGHLPFYELRDECFEYMEANGIPYEKTSAGFTFCWNQVYVDLKPKYRFIYNMQHVQQYVIYSNISNLEDYMIDELADKKKWAILKDFRKGPVFISIYKRVE